MVLLNFVVFVVFKILFNLVSMQNLLYANNCWHKQNSLQRDLIFIFNVLSGSAIGFLSFLVP